MSWSEPAKWYQTIAQLARSEGHGRFPWFWWVVMFCLYTGLMVWEWSVADPAVRASVPKLMGISAGGFGFLIGTGWICVRYNQTKRTTLREAGIVHGSRLKKQWIPWASIEYFCVVEGRVGPWNFKLLTWKKRDEEDEDFSVVPESVEISRVVGYLTDRGVEQVADCKE